MDDSIAPYLEGAFITSMLQDWQQTRSFLNQPDKYHEANPLLGTNPSPEKVTAAGLGSILAQYGAYRNLEGLPKIAMAAIPLALDARAVRNNMKLGFPLNKPLLGLGAALTALEVSRHNRDKKEAQDNLDFHLTYDKGPGFVVNYRW